METQEQGNHDGVLQPPLASLQLPHMPMPENLNSSHDHEDAHTRPVHSPSTPTICVLVVSDVDLSSSSALAEYALQQKRYGVFDATLVDLCIACGPFCRDDDLDDYRKGGRNNYSSSKSATSRRKTPFQHKPVNQDLTSSTGDLDQSSGTAQYRSCDWSRTPFFRSNEENAALEGNMTATLSQLESIVCRLLFCPGSSDPLTTFSPSATNQSQLKINRQQYDRLTPNSRNINHLWFPLAPGLGCGGLFYLDSFNALLSRPNTASFISNSDRNVSSSSSTNQYGYGDDEEDDLSEEQVSMRTLEELSHQAAKLGQSNEGYFSTLSRLLRLPAHTSTNNASSSTEIPLKAAQPQSVLVTHYVDSLALTRFDSSADSNPTMPWPIKLESGSSSSNDRQDFYDSNSNLVCLEIASGSSRSIPAQWIQSPFSENRPDLKANVLLPGSLRERGEFSLVYMGLVETCNDRDPSEKRFEWKVLDINIHHLGAFPEE